MTTSLQTSGHPPSLLSIVEVLEGTEAPVEWLVPHLLTRGSLVVLAGDAGAGKSLLCYALGLALAGRVPFLGHPVSSATVLYFDQENSRPDAIQYLRWAWHGLKCPPLASLQQHFHFAPFQLGSRHWAERAALLIEPLQPALLIFDTATPCCDIRDENDNGEATQTITTIRRLQALVSPPATALVLKHAKILTEHHQRTIRGAKAWLGAADSVMFLIRPAGRPRADGLVNTRLEPWKTRAFGLRTTLHITPVWTADRLGLTLTAPQE